MTNLNTAPPPEKSHYREQLERDYANHIEAVEEVKALAKTMPNPCNDDIDVGKIGDLVKQMTAREKAIEAVKKDEKRSWLEGGRTVDNFFGYLIEDIAKARTFIVRVQQDYLMRKEVEKRRIQAEEEQTRRIEAQRAMAEAEAARQAAIVAQARADRLERQARDSERMKALAEKERDNAKALLAKAEERTTAAIQQEQKAHHIAQTTEKAKPADYARTRSGSGDTLTTLAEVWTFEILDARDIPFEQLKPFFKAEHVRQAVQTYVDKGNRELKGVRIYSDRGVRNL